MLSGHSCLSQNIREKEREREIEGWILSEPQHQQKTKKVLTGWNRRTCVSLNKIISAETTSNP